MKKYLFFILLLSLACNEPTTNNDADVPDTADNTEQDESINDLWSLEKIEGEDFVFTEQNGLREVPQLEIIVFDKTFSGNDGCNRIQGKIAKLNDREVQFGEIASTKMACQNTQIPDQFTQAIRATKKYNVKAGRLFLYDQDNKELLRMKATD